MVAEGTLISWGPSFTYLRNYNHAGELEDEQFRGNVNPESSGTRVSPGGGQPGTGALWRGQFL